MERVAEHLNAGGVVCLFPEGMISRTGHLAEFRSGFERAAALADESVRIVPFYLHGLWGTQFSLASKSRKSPPRGSHRDVVVALSSAWVDTVKAGPGELAIGDTLADSLSAGRALTAAIAFSRRIAKSARKTI